MYDKIYLSLVKTKEGMLVNHHCVAGMMYYKSKQRRAVHQHQCNQNGHHHHQYHHHHPNHRYLHLYITINYKTRGGGFDDLQSFSKSAKCFFACQILSEVLKHVLLKGGGEAWFCQNFVKT